MWAAEGVVSVPASPGGLRASAAAALGYVAASGVAAPLLRFASRVRGGPAFAVLTYHRVGNSDDRFFFGIEPDAFREQMTLLASRWRVLPLSELLARAAAGTLPPESAAITFDDNYRSVHELALPILSELNLSATIFAPTSPLVDGGRALWFDRVLHAFKHAGSGAVSVPRVPGLERPVGASSERRYAAALRALAWMKRLGEDRREAALDLIEEALEPAPLSQEPGHALADWDQLHAWVAAGGEVGSHTVTHPILSRLSRERIREELVWSRRVLEEGLDAPVRTFAYPNGGVDDLDEMVCAEVARAGYEFAFTTQAGIHRRGWFDRRFELSRIDAAETGARHLLLRLAALEFAA